MIKNSSIREFAILSFGEESVRGCVFRRRKGEYAILRYAIETVDSGDPAQAWKRLLRQLGRGRECPLFLSGALAKGVFFRFDSIELPPRARREALEMELPQRIPAIPENHQLQFYAETADAAGNVPVNVYVIPGSSLEHPAAMLTQAGGRADEFLYPLLAWRAGDPAVDLPRLDPDFGFADGEWRPSPENPDYGAWISQFKTEFKLPAAGDFRVEEYLECLLAARLVSQPGFGQAARGLRLLPDQLRPRRCRNQLRIAALLALLLVVNYAWSAAGGVRTNYLAHRAAVAERDRVKRENTALASKLKASEKEQRELARVVNLQAGEPEIIEKLATLTELLPQNALVSSLRWSEGSVDLQIQSEAENLDLPSLLRRAPYWKIGQLQQRRMGDTVTMITLRLVPNEEAAK